MSEELFHNDETRWEVFVAIESKVGTRWYLWVTRSPSMVFYCLDPSRSAAVPGAHLAGVQADQVIIVCDRYSAYTGGCPVEGCTHETEESARQPAGALVGTHPVC